jgi:hypothetical protein
VRQAERDIGRPLGLTTDERTRFKQLEREKPSCVGSTGDSYDNTPAETVIGLFKTEEISRRGPGKGLEDVEFATRLQPAWRCSRNELSGNPGRFSPRVRLRGVLFPWCQRAVSPSRASRSEQRVSLIRL